MWRWIWLLCTWDLSNMTNIASIDMASIVERKVVNMDLRSVALLILDQGGLGLLLIPCFLYTSIIPSYICNTSVNVKITNSTRYIPKNTGRLIYLSKIHSKMFFFRPWGDLQHPCCKIVALLYFRYYSYNLSNDVVQQHKYNSKLI